MRILFLHHAPLEDSEVGRLTARWQTSLAEAGHQRRVLVVDTQNRNPGDRNIERVICRANDAAADLPFDVPRFSGDPHARLTFGQLSDQQLQQYRDVLRRRLDGQVDRFNPHVLHVQYVSLLGQLAVETGVPYVTSVWGPELQPAELDTRWRRWRNKPPPMRAHFGARRGDAAVASRAIRIRNGTFDDCPCGIGNGGRRIRDDRPRGRSAAATLRVAASRAIWLCLKSRGRLSLTPNGIDDYAAGDQRQADQAIERPCPKHAAQ